MKFTDHFNDLLSGERSDLKLEWVERVLAAPEKVEVQSNGRTRYWKRIPELQNKALRVVMLEDGETIMTAFPDRMYDRRKAKP